ncbi:MAG: murein biosynthesis integral membrane protein MurJ [Pseudomonadota bacterium]
MRGFATVGLWTMASRVLGFVRDMVVVAMLGVGPVAEAFFVAFTLPNLFRRFFAEGAFNTAFVPMFALRLEGQGRAVARRFAEDAFAALAGLLIALSLLAQLAMPWLVLALASGTAGDARFDLSVVFGRIVFPYILLISLAALLSGVLNAAGRFAAAAAAPVLLNVTLIAALGAVAAGGMGADRQFAGTVLSWGVVVAGVLQLALVWFAARQAGFGLALRLPRLTPEMRQLAILAAPAALAGGVMQINLVIGRQVASYWEGAIGWLWVADRLYQLPLGVIGVAIGVVLLPSLSRHVLAGDSQAAGQALNRSAEFALVLTLPATAALVAMPELMTRVLFERGAFTVEDAAATGLALAIYAAGLPAFVLQKVLQPAFFAREDTRTPLRFALWSMVVTFVVAVGGAPLMGWIAAPLGTSAAAWVQVLLLARGASGRGGRTVAFQPDARLRQRWPRALVAAVAMGLAVALAAEAATTPGLIPAARWAEALALAIIVLGGAALYGALLLALGGFTRADLAAALGRGRRSTG